MLMSATIIYIVLYVSYANVWFFSIKSHTNVVIQLKIVYMSVMTTTVFITKV